MSFPPVETKPTIVVWIVGIGWTDEHCVFPWQKHTKSDQSPLVHFN